MPRSPPDCSSPSARWRVMSPVVVLLERLLAGSSRSTVLATSRARLLVPFERVFLVPGLSAEADDGGPRRPAAGAARTRPPRARSDPIGPDRTRSEAGPGPTGRVAAR